MAFFHANLVSFVILSIGIQTSTSQSCDAANGWELHGENCYYVETRDLSTRQLSWHEARENCQFLGAELATPISTAESQFIYDMSKTHISGFHASVWVGVTNLDNLDIWKYVDGKTFTGSENWGDLWHTSQPAKDDLKRCAYQFHREKDDFCYSQVSGIEYITAALGSPSGIDQQESWKFDYLSDPDADNCATCEERCQEKENCVFYTHFASSYSNTDWKHWCIGRSDKFPGGHAGTPHPFVCSGSRTICEGDGEWYTDNCGVKRGFACQKPVGGSVPTPPPTSATAGHCPRGYIEHGNKCFVIKEYGASGDTGFEWEEALNRCEDLRDGGMNPSLASFHNSADLAAVAMHLNDEHHGFWIGFYREGGSDQWVWTDNSKVDLIQYPYRLPKEGDKACGEMETIPGPIGIWTVTDCSANRGYICQVQKDPNNVIPTAELTTPSYNCPSGQVAYRKACYIVLEQPSPWRDAESECVKLGLLPLSQMAEKTMRCFITFCMKILQSGLEFVSGEGEWTFIDEYPVVYTNWGTGFPSTNNNSCGVLVAQGTWHSASCDTESSFKPLCKIDSEPVPTHPTQRVGYCQNDTWVQFGEHCYWFPWLFDLPTWPEARAICQGFSNYTADPPMEVDLVSIHSLEENQFVFSQLKKKTSRFSAWIGRYMPKPDEAYQWSDGSPDQFEKFLPGHPDDEAGQNLCIKMTVALQYTVGYWSSSACDAAAPYACKTRMTYTDSSPEAQTGSDLSGGAIAGIVIGVLLGVAALGVVGWYLVRRFDLASKLPGGPNTGDTHTAFDNPIQYNNMDKENQTTNGQKM